MRGRRLHRGREIRADRIVQIDLAGSVTVTEVVTCAIGAIHFTDFLTLVRIDDRWQIIAKVVHAEARIHGQGDWTISCASIRITREGARPTRKTVRIRGTTAFLIRVLARNPAMTRVVIDEVALEVRGLGGFPVNESGASASQR